MTKVPSDLAKAHLQRRLEDLRKRKAILDAQIKNLEDKVDELNAELVAETAPYELDAKKNFRNGVLVLFLAALLGLGFVFFAEYSLVRIGFEWSRWKLFGAGLIFWLGTVAATKIYLSARKTEFSSLPGVFRVFPLILILTGVVVLALARGLTVFSAGASDTLLAQLASIAQWSGLIAQITFSLGLDLGSGVVGWVGIDLYNSASPIWRRYRLINLLETDSARLRDELAVVAAELNQDSPQSVSQSASQNGDGALRPEPQPNYQTALGQTAGS